MTALSTAVVVCAYTLERWDDLVESLSSAAGQSPAPDELWLVVDHNPALLERATVELSGLLPGLHVVANSRQKGLSGARNTAVEHVSSDVVVFLDDDAAAVDGWLGRLLTAYRSDSVIAVGGSAVPRWPDGRRRPVTLPAESGRRPGELDWVVGCTYAGQPEELQPVRNLMGCNMSIRREVFVRVGGFSEELGRVGKTPLGCEETEFCIRARKAFPSAEILFEPQARVRHHVSVDRLSWAYLRRRAFAEGVSKAAVTALVGSDAALATERDYVRTILPRAVRRQLRGAFRSSSTPRFRNAQGALAIIVALGLTAAGYARGLSASRHLSSVPVAHLALDGTFSGS